MNEFRHTCFPGLGGLNYDDDNHAMPENDYRYACNIIDVEDGHEKIVVNIKGCEAKANVLPSGNNKIIAFKEDVENKAGIFFIYNSNGYHSIHRYNSDSEDFTVILDGDQANGYGDTVGDILDFDEDDTLDVDIIGSGVATKDGEGQLLLWVGGSNPPRKINITKAINFTAGSGTPAYTAISDIEINQIKQPPLAPPVLALYTDTSRNINNIRGRLYQVAVQYIYDDNEVSVMSPVAKVVIPQDEEFCNGFYTGNIAKNNRIRVSFAPVTYDTVVGVNILIREGDVGSGVIGDWMLYDSIEIVNGTPTLYYIYGDKIPTALSQSDILRNYDAIGQEVRRQALINDSKVLHGDITEGYDNVDINVSLNVVRQGLSVEVRDALEYYYRTTETTIAVNITAKLPAHVRATTATPHGYVTNDIITITGTTDYNGDHTITVEDDNNFYFTETYVSDQSGTAQPKAMVIEFPYSSSVERYMELTILQVGGSYFRYQLPNTYGKTQLQVSQYFDDRIDNEGVAHDFSCDVVSNYIRIAKTAATELRVFVYTYKFVDKYKTHNDGATYYYGIVYYDEHGNRCGFVNISDDSLIYIPSHNGQGVYGHNAFINGVKMQIKHIPPTWAYKYQIVCAKSSLLWKRSYVVNFTEVVEDTETEYYKIKISDAIDRINGYLQGSKLSDYTFNDGDRLRILGHYNANMISSVSKGAVTLFSGNVMDVPIARQDDSGYIYIPVVTNNKQFVDYFEDTATSSHYILIDIYHPAEYDEEDLYYFEMGECFSILNPGTANRAHGAGNSAMGETSQAQDPNNPVTTPAICVLTGDCYLITVLWDKCTTGKIPIVLPVNSESMSMFYNSEKSDEGRFHTVNVSAIRKRYDRIRWSGKYVDDSNLNFLSRFEFDDTKPLDSRYGRIFKMKQRGGVLRVYQENKVTSFNLDSTTSTDADGNVIVSYSDQIVSDGIQSIENYGLKHPKSFAEKGSYFYYFDFNNFSVIRDAVNGSIPVSKYKMNKFFKEKVQQIISLGEDNFDIIGAVDESNDAYLITFKEKTANQIYTISNHSATVLGTVLASCLTDHNLTTGDRIRIWNSPYYNGTYEVVVVTSNSFYFYATFVASGSPYWDRSETLIFHEPSNRWKSFELFASDLYGKIQNKFISFPDHSTYLDGGELFIHESDSANRVEFYGHKFKAYIRFILGSPEVKIFNSMEQHSTKVWDLGKNDSIKIEASDKYTNGMQSRIKSARFDNIEGVYYANFLKDMLTRGSTPELYSLFNGRDLRGKMIELNMTVDSDDQVRLTAVVVNSQISK